MVQSPYPEYSPPAQTGQGPKEVSNGVDRVLAVLRTLADHPRGITLTAMVECFDAPKTSIHRALTALRRAGLARQDTDGRYHLGQDFVRLAYRYQEARDDYRLIEPALRALAESFGETAHYATLDGPDVVYVAKVTPRDGGIQMSSSIGGRNPAYCTGVGKALLMHTLTTTAAVEEFVEHHGPLQPRTPHTLISATTLADSLHQSRERGYAVDDEENERGISCIAFALFLDSTHAPSGAISITALAQRTPLTELHRISGSARAIIRQHLGDVLR